MNITPFCRFINTTPKEITTCILSFVPGNWLWATNKYYYIHYRFPIEGAPAFHSSYFQRYIRWILRNNMDFAFRCLWIRNGRITENLHKKYTYNKEKYKFYVDFLIMYCQKNEASRCIPVLRELIEKPAIYSEKKVNKKTTKHIYNEEVI